MSNLKSKKLKDPWQTQYQICRGEDRRGKKERGKKGGQGGGGRERERERDKSAEQANSQQTSAFLTTSLYILMWI